MANELCETPISMKPISAPATAYQRAQEEWDNRIGSARVQARNWRLAALSMTGVAALAIGGMIYQATRSSVVPYVVQVNSTGMVQAVGPAKQTNHTPNHAEIKYFLSQFVNNVRSVPLDPVVAKNQWLEAYQYLRQSAANTLNEIARKEQPLSRIGQETVAVQVVNITAISEYSYQVRWTETKYNREGVSVGTKNMTGVFSIEISPPTEEKQLLTNPLGLYIKQLSWSQDV